MDNMKIIFLIYQQKHTVTSHNPSVCEILMRGHKICYMKICGKLSLLFCYLFLSGSGCSKLTTSLVNVSLNFQMSISEIHQYFLLKKCEKLLQCKSFSHFFNKKIQCIWL